MWNTVDLSRAVGSLRTGRSIDEGLLPHLSTARLGAHSPDRRLRLARQPSGRQGPVSAPTYPENGDRRGLAVGWLR